MNIRKFVCIGEIEVNVPVSAEDIAAALVEDPATPTVLVGINNIAQYLKAISPEMIAAMNRAQRQTIGDFLAEQANRYRYE